MVPAEVEEQPFKHQNRAGAAEDDERLAAQQTEHAPADGRAHEALQHALHMRGGGTGRSMSHKPQKKNCLNLRSQPACSLWRLPACRQR